jgi:hypothetical protein
VLLGGAEHSLTVGVSMTPIDGGLLADTGRR